MIVPCFRSCMQYFPHALNKLLPRAHFATAVWDCNENTQTMHKYAHHWSLHHHKCPKHDGTASSIEKHVAEHPHGMFRRLQASFNRPQPNLSRAHHVWAARRIDMHRRRSFVQPVHLHVQLKG